LNAVAYKEVMGAKWAPKVKTGENKKFLTVDPFSLECSCI
jgi:hypothetical protein